MTPLTMLKIRYECAAEVLGLLEQGNAATEAVLAQRDHCQSLRKLMNDNVPDSKTYDPRADNIVAVIR